MIKQPTHNDSGATLILAIGFVLMVSVIAAALAGLATSSLNNRNTLESIRNREYVADGAVEQAITTVRGLGGCTVPATSDYVLETWQSIVIRVDWLNPCGSVLATDGTSYPQRTGVFSACVNPTPTAACDPAALIIRAQVNFEPASGPVTKTFIQSWNVIR